MQDFIISGSLLKNIKLSPNQLMIDLSVYLYDKERLTMGQAKKLAGLSQVEFQKELSKRNINIKYEVEDFEDDLKTLENLSDK
jgi:predicted HTH domain antitoxin